MPKVLPSDIVVLLKRVRNLHGIAGTHWSIPSVHEMDIAGLARLLDDIPRELLTLSPSEYAKFLVHVEGLRRTLSIWERDPNSVLKGLTFDHLIELLEMCPDEVPAPSTAGLLFIGDPALREDLRIDISAAWAALRDGQFKTSTVMAGAALEGLLLWAIGEAIKAGKATFAEAVALLPEKMQPKRKGDLNDLMLAQYIAISYALKLIDGRTRDQALLAKDARNLIHPGREQRTSERCDRGTALSALAAVERTTADLAREFGEGAKEPPAAGISSPARDDGHV